MQAPLALFVKTKLNIWFLKGKRAHMFIYDNYVFLLKLRKPGEEKKEYELENCTFVKN